MKKILAYLLVIVLLSTTCISGEGMVVKADTAGSNSVGNTGKTYYVDADNGNDSNSGLSEKEPWQSIQKVNETTFEPGDAILFKRGCVWTDSVLMPQGSGDENNQNYISCYGDEKKDLPAIISRYSDDVENLPDKDTTLLMKNQNYWTIEKLSLTNASEGSGDQSIAYITAGSGSRLKGFVLRDCVFNGSDPEQWSKLTKSGLSGIVVSAYIDSLLIENNHISNVKALGININGQLCGVDYKGVKNEKSGKGVVIRNNYLENIGKDGIFVNNCYEPLVEYNVVNKAHSYAQNTHHVAIWAFASYGALFQYNEAYDTKTIYDGQGFDCDYECYDTTFQYNYSHDNTGGFMLICVEPSAAWMPKGYSYNVGSTVRYNISQNDSHYTFTLTGGIQETKIYNNTIYVGRNTPNLTNYFFLVDKGENTLTKLRYPDDILVANNIFYSDTMSYSGLEKCSNVVFNNNMFAGKSQMKYFDNGAVTYKKDSDGNDKLDENGNKIYEIKEAKGNIWGYNPMFVNPGRASTGRDSCDAYYLYKGSQAIGNGMVIDENEYKTRYSCDTDFFGNPIDKQSVNIGAYAGKGVERTNYIYDNKYETLIDFERDDEGEIGTGTWGQAMTGIERCIEAYRKAAITDDVKVQNKNTGSKKCLALTNNTDTAISASAKFYVYETEFNGANGLRLWLDPNGSKAEYTVDLSNGTKTYSKTFYVQKAGWKVLTFNEVYDGSDYEPVTPEAMRGITSIGVSAKLEPGYTVYVDDIQINKGEMDSQDVYQYTYDKAKTLIIEDFETADVNTQPSNHTEHGDVSSGPAGKMGIEQHNGSIAFYATATSVNTTGAEHYYKWQHTFDNLKEAIAGDGQWEGIQMNMEMTLRDSEGNPLTSDEMKKLKSWNKFKIILKSEHAIPFEKATNGQIQYFYAENCVADSNGIIRVAFDTLKGKYTEDGKTKTINLGELGEEEVKEWKNNISRIGVGIRTQGSDVGKSVESRWYMDNIAVYKDEQHEDSELRVVKEATCTEDGIKQKLCPVCGIAYDTELIPALGHSYEWVISKEATVSEAGEEKLTCTRCGDVSETREIPKIVEPETPEEPETPQEPETPKEPENPEDPEKPGNSDNPGGSESGGNTTKSDIVVKGALKYKIICNIEERREVSVVGVAKKNTTRIIIPSTVKINKKTYNVTVISKKAFYKNKKMTTLIIGKNVEAIGKQAFYGCSRLKTLKITTSKLTSKYIFSSAFSKGYSKIKVIVPKKKLTYYKKILRAKGMSKRALVKA